MATAEGQDGATGFAYAQVRTRGRRRARDKGVNELVKHGEPSTVVASTVALAEEKRARHVRIITEKRHLLASSYDLAQKTQKCIDMFVSQTVGTGKGKEPQVSLPDTLIALGLGKVTESRSAQLQLAWFLDLVESVRSRRERAAAQSDANSDCKVLAFDPICDADDKAVLEAMGVTVCGREEVRPQRFRTATVLFMPHCPRPLYEQYLRANWTDCEQLERNLFLCCNRLATYAENLPSTKLAKESPCIWRSLPHLRFEALPTEPGPMMEALNDLGFHRFFFEQSSTNFIPEQPGNPGSAEGNVANGDVQSSSALATIPNEAAMQTVARSKRKTRRRGRSGIQQNNPTVAEEEALLRRFDPKSSDFWSLPEPIQSDADAEVL